MPSLRSYLAGAALAALSVGSAHAADKADCTNPPHPLLNWCAGSTAYSARLSLNMKAVAKELDFVQALGKPAADDEVVAVDALSGAFAKRLEDKLREPSEGKVRFPQDGGVLRATNHAYAVVGVVSPDPKDDIQVCFQGGATEKTQKLLAVFNIQPNGTVSNTTARYAGVDVCKTFALAARDEIKKKPLAENTPAPSMQ